jgi:hypothetical protein
LEVRDLESARDDHLADLIDLDMPSISPTLMPQLSSFGLENKKWMVDWIPLLIMSAFGQFGTDSSVLDFGLLHGMQLMQMSI